MKGKHPIDGDVGPMYCYRTQSDNYGDLVSRENVLSCADFPDLARQEFKDDADINVIMHRFGADAPQRPVSFGVRDFDLGLQEGIHALETALDSYDRQPQEVKERFGSPGAYMAAVESGEFAKFIREQKEVHSKSEEDRKRASRKAEREEARADEREARDREEYERWRSNPKKE